MQEPKSRSKPSAEAIALRDLIICGAASRGAPLEQYDFRVRHGLPVLKLRLGQKVLRGCWIGLPGRPRSGQPDVITVHGSGHRASKMWPRKSDGTFNIEAVVEHLLTLVEVEMSRTDVDVDVPSGLPAALSGLHVVHVAAVRLGVLDAHSEPKMLVELVADERARAGVEKHLAGVGLTDRDMRALGDAAGVCLSRPNKMDFDPFEPINDRILYVVQIGQLKGDAVERRYVLILDRTYNEVELADPSGDGQMVMTVKKLDDAWQLASKKGRPWIATVSVPRRSRSQPLV